MTWKNFHWLVAVKVINEAYYYSKSSILPFFLEDNLCKYVIIKLYVQLRASRTQTTTQSTSVLQIMKYVVVQKRSDYLSSIYN